MLFYSFFFLATGYDLSRTDLNTWKSIPCDTKLNFICGAKVDISQGRSLPAKQTLYCPPKFHFVDGSCFQVCWYNRFILQFHRSLLYQFSIGPHQHFRRYVPDTLSEQRLNCHAVPLIVLSFLFTLFTVLNWCQMRVLRTRGLRNWTI